MTYFLILGAVAVIVLIAATAYARYSEINWKTPGEAKKMEPENEGEGESK